MHNMRCIAHFVSSGGLRAQPVFHTLRASTIQPSFRFLTTVEDAGTSAETSSADPEIRVPGSSTKVANLPEDLSPSLDTLTADSLPHFIRKPKPQTLALRDALGWVKENAKAKFDETVELSLRLGVDPKRSDQVVRGMAVLPHGTGKSTRVAVFARGAEADEARAAGADVVGAEEIVAEIKRGGSGAINFDRAIGHPSVMPILGQIARILGPRGLMPNPKLGTLTTNITEAVKRAKQGQVEFRMNKEAIIHVPVGKVSFEVDTLEENVFAIMKAIGAAKPQGLKGAAAGAGFLKKCHLSSTQGRSVIVPKDALANKLI